MKKTINPKKPKEEYDQDLDTTLLTKKEKVTNKSVTIEMTDEELRVLVRLLGDASSDSGDVDHKRYCSLLKKFGR